MGANRQYGESRRADGSTLRGTGRLSPKSLRRFAAITLALLTILSPYVAAADSQAILFKARNLHERGQTPAAEKLLRSEYETAKAAKDELHQAWMAFGLGWGMHQMARHVQSAKWLSESSDMAERLKEEELEGMARYHYGLALRQLGHRPLAKVQLEKGAEKLRNSQRYDMAAMAVLDLARLEPNFRAREAILRTAVEQAGKNARPRLEGQLLLAWADSQFNEGNSAGAMATFRRAIELLEKRPDSSPAIRGVDRFGPCIPAPWRSGKRAQRIWQGP